MPRLAVEAQVGFLHLITNIRTDFIFFSQSKPLLQGFFTKHEKTQKTPF